jgi:hypothetical protein
MLRDLFFDYVIPIAPVVLLSITWTEVIRSNVPHDAPFVRWMPHLIATSSELYYWLTNIAPRQLLGRDYSDLRHHLILANLFAALGIAIILFFWRVVARWWLFAASLSLALAWLWVAAVQAAV